jgi:hypothetical protein
LREYIATIVFHRVSARSTEDVDFVLKFIVLRHVTDVIKIIVFHWPVAASITANFPIIDDWVVTGVGASIYCTTTHLDV